jgi:hypothetical protein
MTAGEIIDIQSEIISMQAKAIRDLYELLGQYMSAEEMDGLPEVEAVKDINKMRKEIL